MAAGPRPGHAGGGPRCRQRWHGARPLAREYCTVIGRALGCRHELRAVVGEDRTVSDGVVAGTREDVRQVLEQYFTEQGWNVVERALTEDGVDPVARRFGVSPTVSTGSSSPGAPAGHGSHAGGHEGHARWEAPGLAEAMRLINPLGRLSRGRRHARHQPDRIRRAHRRAVETIGAVIDVLPHAVTLLDNYDPSSGEGQGHGSGNG